MIQKAVAFIKNSRQEFKRVNWPTRKQTTRYTLFIIVLSVAVAAYLGFLDYLFVQALSIII